MNKLVIRVGLTLSIFLLFMRIAQAAGYTLYYIGDVSQQEYEVLPSYCQKFTTNKAAEHPKFSLDPTEVEITKGISGLHHYCRIPVLRMRQMRERDAYKKDYLLTLLIDEANYVATYSKPDAPLVASAYLEKARALVGKRQDGKAIVEYYNALRVNPKEAAPYLDLARLFEKQSNKQKALEIITEGLKHNPGKSLKKRYQELGGKEPFPTPETDIVTPIDNPPKPQPTAEPVATKQITTQDTVQQSNSITQQAPPLDNSSDTNKASGNSYCRFCP